MPRTILTLISKVLHKCHKLLTTNQKGNSLTELNKTTVLFFNEIHVLTFQFLFCYSKEMVQYIKS